MTGAGERHFTQLDHIAIGVEGEFGNAADDILELFVAGNEVGFGIDFHGSGLGAGGHQTNQTFGSDAISLLGGLGQTTGAQPIDSSFHVAIGFGQSLLAVHHPDASRVAELLDHCSSDFHGFTSCRP
jgi:hypothetical protein